TVFKVFFLFRRCLRQVWDLIALHDAQPRRNCAGRTKCDHRSRSRHMVLEVPVCRVESLPNTVQVCFAVHCAWCLIAVSPSRGRCHAQLNGRYHQDGCSTRKSRTAPPISHLCVLPPSAFPADRPPPLMPLGSKTPVYWTFRSQAAGF